MGVLNEAQLRGPEVQAFYAPDRWEGGNKRCFCPSVSLCLSVRRVELSWVVSL